MAITLYGIPNCDTVRKARKWLTGHDIEYDFHDFRKQGLDRKTVEHWIDALGSESLNILINRRGTTWRKLGDSDKQKADQVKTAIDLMLENTSLIKRPVLDDGKKLHVGFNAESWDQLFAIN